MDLCRNLIDAGLEIAPGHEMEWMDSPLPPLLNGSPGFFASVVVRQDMSQIIVLLGGKSFGVLLGSKYARAANFVSLLNLQEVDKRWREGPRFTKGDITMLRWFVVEVFMFLEDARNHINTWIASSESTLLPYFTRLQGTILHHGRHYLAVCQCQDRNVRLRRFTIATLSWLVELQPIERIWMETPCHQLRYLTQ